MTHDFTVLGGGSLYLLQPHTEAAVAWVHDHIASDAQYLGTAVAVEHRYINDIVVAIRGEGLTVDD